MADLKKAWDKGSEAYAKAQEGDYQGMVQAGLEGAAASGVTDLMGDCAGGIAEGAVGGAAAGAAAGAALGPVGAIIGGIAGGLLGAFGGSDACEGASEVPPKGKVYNDVGFPSWRLGMDWTPEKNERERADDKRVVTSKGLTLGTLKWMLRRARELGGGVQDYRRILRVILNEKDLRAKLANEHGIDLSTQPTMAYFEQLGDPAKQGLWQQIMFDVEAAKALRRGGFDLPSIFMLSQGNYKELRGNPPDFVAAQYAELQRLLANYEAQYSPEYTGKIRNILPRPNYKRAIAKVQKGVGEAVRKRLFSSLKGQTRSLQLEGATLPLLLVGGAAAAWYFTKGQK